MNIQTPKVELVDWNRDALELLIYTKSTRLQGRQTLEAIKAWPMSKKLEELAYMRDTIQSSWEFIEYTFLVSGVSRSFTHQYVRTRSQSGIDDPAYGLTKANPAILTIAQESQRTVNAADNGVVVPPVQADVHQWFLDRLEVHMRDYQTALDMGEPPQNARFLAPHAISTSIITKWSLRALHDSAEVRLCTRTQGEYQDIFRMMREEVMKVHPWVKGWIEVFCVNHGTCCFPRYKKCPIQGPLFNPETGLRFDEQMVDVVMIDGLPIEQMPVRPAKRSEVLQMWESTRHEATPVARDGKTM